MSIRRSSLLHLTLLVGLILAGLFLQVDAHSAAIGGVHGPECLLRGLFSEHACPSCGLTRATGLALHGQLGAAARVHIGGIAMALALAFWCLLYAFTAWRNRVPDPVRRWLGLSRVALLLTVAVGWWLRQ
ncbi:MAG: DUF2752 domain-containing protein [Planctomycetota bacterium]